MLVFFLYRGIAVNFIDIVLSRLEQNHFLISQALVEFIISISRSLQVFALVVRFIHALLRDINVARNKKQPDLLCDSIDKEQFLSSIGACTSQQQRSLISLENPIIEGRSTARLNKGIRSDLAL